MGQANRGVVMAFGIQCFLAGALVTSLARSLVFGRGAVRDGHWLEHIMLALAIVLVVMLYRQLTRPVVPPAVNRDDSTS